jgi:uncharacterized membrane protein
MWVSVWSRDHFSNRITDADEACRSSEISVYLIIIIVLYIEIEIEISLLHWEKVMMKFTNFAKDQALVKKFKKQQKI